MGTDLRIQDLVDSRVEIVERLLDRLRSWDGAMESGINLIETNQEDYDELKLVDERIREFTISTTDEQEYIDNLNALAREQNKLSQGLRRGQEDLLQGMKELNKKSKVINSYISVQRGTVFVDKDV